VRHRSPRSIRASIAVVALLATTALGCASLFSRTPPTSPLAYEIETPTGAKGWLFGSIHLGRPEGQALPPRLARALEEAELLVLEIDLSSTSEADLAATMLELGTLEDGLRLRDVISRDTWTAVVTRSQETGSNLAALDRLEPWVVSFFFTSQMFQAAGLESDHGVERNVMAAKSAAKPVRGLETPRQQFAAFDGLSYALQERMLADAVAAPTEGDDGIGGLLEAWRQGDTAWLEAILFEDLNDPEMAPFFESTYFRRNRQMARGLEDILAEQSGIFAVIGVGHLLGEEGIPVLLEQAGFRVERVRFR
jgi:uncharacterized protein YbaP (TraB family)